MPETTDLFWHTTFFAKFNMLRSLSMHFLGNIEEAYTPNYFPVGQGHNFPHKVWKDFFYKSFSWQMGDNLLGGCSTWKINIRSCQGLGSFTNTFFSNHFHFFQSWRYIHLNIKPWLKLWKYLYLKLILKRFQRLYHV